MQVMFGDGYSGNNFPSACGWFARVGFNLTFYIPPYATVCPDTLAVPHAFTLVNYWDSNTTTASISPEPSAHKPPLSRDEMLAIILSAAAVTVMLAVGVAVYAIWRCRAEKAHRVVDMKSVNQQAQGEIQILPVATTDWQ
jgi:hypothetical protein